MRVHRAKILLILERPSQLLLAVEPAAQSRLLRGLDPQAELSSGLLQHRSARLIVATETKRAEQQIPHVRSIAIVTGRHRAADRQIEGSQSEVDDVNPTRD